MSDKLFFKKDSPEIIQISSLDQRLDFLTDLIGEYSLVLRTGYFASLLRAIIGQQLSVSSAKAIWDKTVRVCNSLEPKTILSTSVEDLRKAGLSKQKIMYVKDLSQRVLSGETDLNKLALLEDEQVIETLTAVKGIGVWTAEMFLIFSLGRLDVWPTKDLGLQKAIKWLYGLEDIPGSKGMRNYGERWKPYRTVIALYLWETINRKIMVPVVELLN